MTGASLATGLLASVSRSFYLSLRILPGAVRAPLSLSYLLARAADTIADEPEPPAAARLALLDEFAAVVGGREVPEFYSRVAKFAGNVKHDGERVLLMRLGECFAALELLTAAERECIREVLGHILRGQMLDLERFGDGSAHADTGLVEKGPSGGGDVGDSNGGGRRFKTVATGAELDEYTWLVAGCVGEFWTRICALRVRRFSRLPLERLTALAVTYGKGLQLINILRDQPKDVQAGRCYLPLDALRTAGLRGEPVWPASDWKVWHAVRKPLLKQARENLQAGREYVRALYSVRLRLAALLPLLIGEATLDLMDNQPDDAAPVAAKINRADVKRLLRRGLWLALTNRA